MFTAFVRQPDGSTHNPQSLGEIAPADYQDGAALWIDLEQPEDGDIRRLGELFKLDAEALEDCLKSEQHPRVDEFENYIFIVFYALRTPHQEEQDYELEQLAAFCNENLLITIHHRTLKTVRLMRERCRTHGGQLLGRGIDYLLYNLIDGMVDRYDLAVESYETRIDELEDASLEEDLDESILGSVTELRRDLLELRRVAASQREMMQPVARGDYDYIDEALEHRFGQVRDHLEKVVGQIDTLRERIYGIRDNYHSALAMRTNDVMKALTVFAAILLPCSVIAGVYGMNLPLWPPANHPSSFWFVLGLMIVIPAALLYLFRRKKWI